MKKILILTLFTSLQVFGLDSNLTIKGEKLQIEIDTNELSYESCSVEKYSGFRDEEVCDGGKTYYSSGVYYCHEQRFRRYRDEYYYLKGFYQDKEEQISGSRIYTYRHDKRTIDIKAYSDITAYQIAEKMKEKLIEAGKCQR